MELEKKRLTDLLGENDLSSSIFIFHHAMHATRSFAKTGTSFDGFCFRAQKWRVEFHFWFCLLLNLELEAEPFDSPMEFESSPLVTFVFYCMSSKKTRHHRRWRAFMSVHRLGSNVTPSAFFFNKALVRVQFFMKLFEEDKEMNSGCWKRPHAWPSF